jgi:hypothetical protein
VTTLTESDLSALRRAGLALAAIGVLDIASCALAVVRGRAYSSSLNVFALVAGIMVYRGHTGAARFVVRGLSFFLGALLVGPLVVPAFTPLRLLWVQMVLSPVPFVEAVSLYVGLMAALYWIRQTVARVPLYAPARRVEPLHRSTAARVGAAIPLGLAIILPFWMNSGAGRRALAEAERQLGPRYSFHVTRLNQSTGGCTATVLAYTDAEVRELEVDCGAN